MHTYIGHNSPYQRTYNIITMLAQDDIIAEILDLVNKFFNLGQNPPKSVEATVFRGGGPWKECEVEFNTTWMPSLNYPSISIKLKVALTVGKQITMEFR